MPEAFLHAHSQPELRVGQRSEGQHGVVGTLQTVWRGFRQQQAGLYFALLAVPREALVPLVQHGDWHRLGDKGDIR